MNKNAPAKYELVFTLAGLCSALVTLALGAFWLTVLVLATGLILSIALLTTEDLAQRRWPLAVRTPLSRRLLAAGVVALSYPCGVVVFVVTVSAFDRLETGLRNILGLSVSGIFLSVAFYWSLRIAAAAKPAALVQLLAIALPTALIAGSTELWGRNFILLKPPFFVSPFWVILLVIGEAGFAWVWGRANRATTGSRT